LILVRSVAGNGSAPFDTERIKNMEEFEKAVDALEIDDMEDIYYELERECA
jgi:hypothetical protein